MMKVIIYVVLLIFPHTTLACSPSDEYEWIGFRLKSEISFQGIVSEIEKFDNYTRAKVSVTKLFRGTISDTFYIRETYSSMDHPCPCEVGFLRQAYLSRDEVEIHADNTGSEPSVCNHFSIRLARSLPNLEHLLSETNRLPCTFISLDNRSAAKNEFRAISNSYEQLMRFDKRYQQVTGNEGIVYAQLISDGLCVVTEIFKISESTETDTIVFSDRPKLILDEVLKANIRFEGKNINIFLIMSDGKVRRLGSQKTPIDGIIAVELSIASLNIMQPVQPMYLVAIAEDDSSFAITSSEPALIDDLLKRLKNSPSFVARQMRLGIERVVNAIR